MDQSQYLVQALQNMAQQPQQAAPQGPSPQQMAQAVQQRKAWEAANPGQSYMGHSVQQIGQNIGNIPQNLANAGQNIAGMPGDAMNALRRLGGGAPGMPGAPGAPQVPTTPPWLGG